jgi:diguanylate cyclase (GGDEF)-like protein
MFRLLLRRYGITAVTMGMTLISILLSVGITWGVNAFVQGGPVGEGWAIAILAPLLIAPLMSVQILHLLSKLDRAEQQLQVLSHTDELTQTYNRRFFMQYVDQELKRIHRSGETFSVAILDMDNFKQINDTYGHMAGDQTLRELTRMLKQQMRQADVLARYGGDEFIMLFPQTNRQQVDIWIRRIYETTAETAISFQGHNIYPSFSIGVAFSTPEMSSTDELLKPADIALYQAKRSGGNTFMFAPDSGHN